MVARFAGGVHSSIRNERKDTKKIVLASSVLRHPSSTLLLRSLRIAFVFVVAVSSSARRGCGAAPPFATLAFAVRPAPSSPPSSARRPSVHLSPKVPSSFRPSGAASASVALSSSSSEGEVPSSPSREGRTGWVHNSPRPDSPFWSRGEEAEAEGDTDVESPATREEEEVPRTGWLHNTVSPSEVERRKKERQAQQQAAGAGTGSSAAGSFLESPARKLLRLEMAKQIRNHRIVSPPMFHPCGDGRRIAITEHKISVPLKRAPLERNKGEGRDPSFARAPGEGLLLSDLEATSGADDEKGPRIDVYFAVAEAVEKEDDEAFFSATLGLASGTINDVRTQRRRADSYVSRANLTDADSLILYLQGGPGFGAPPPVSGLSLAEKGSWAGEALSKGYKRVVLMDQRGTGKSTPVTKQTLERTFPDLFALDDIAGKAGEKNWGESIGADGDEGGEDGNDYGDDDEDGSGGVGRRVAEQLDKWEALNPELAAKVGVGLGQAAFYVACFRADSIVRDAEDVKDALLQPPDEEEAGAEKKARPYGAVLGQSFGGFCVMTYLSTVPHPPRICLLTGGIAPMLTPPFEVYDRLWDRVKERNLRYYERYPGDVGLVKEIVRRLSNAPLGLPSGGVLTARRFLQLGLGLGGSPTAFASLHDLIGGALLDWDGGNAQGNDDLGTSDGGFSRSFLKAVDSAQPFDDHPLYYLLHESIYADGDRPGHSPTSWAAHRALRKRSSSSPADPRPPSDFDYRVTSHPSDDRPTLFFGEMVFPWMAEGDYGECGGFGMRALAQSLAAKDDWGPLYDEERMREALLGDGEDRRSKCRAAAAVYYDDMYVDFDCSMKVVRRGGPLEGCRVWITNDYQHSGLRDDGAAIFAKLLGMAKGSVNTPS